MPLPETQEFSVQVLTPGRNRLMQTLRDSGYVPALRSVMPRVCPNGMEASETWIVDLRDRMPIVDDRPQEHAGEIGKEKSESQEVKAFREAWNKGQL